MAVSNSSEAGDGQYQLLIVTLKNTTGQINFQAVAQEMSLSSSGAAQKRVKRFLDKLSPDVSLLSGSTLGAAGAAAAPTTPKRGTKTAVDKFGVPKTPRTPKTAKTSNKRKAVEIDDDNDEDHLSVLSTGEHVKAMTDAASEDGNLSSDGNEAAKSLIVAPKTHMPVKATKTRVIKTPKSPKLLKPPRITKVKNSKKEIKPLSEEDELDTDKEVVEKNKHDILEAEDEVSISADESKQDTNEDNTEGQASSQSELTDESDVDDADDNESKSESEDDSPKTKTSRGRRKFKGPELTEEERAARSLAFQERLFEGVPPDPITGIRVITI